MSKLLERKDFGPQGFRLLTLKRILVSTVIFSYRRPNISSTLESACQPVMACNLQTEPMLAAVPRPQRKVWRIRASTVLLEI